MEKPDTESFDINLVRLGPLFRCQRRIRLIQSDQELNIGRRIFIAILVTWVPVMLLAAGQGQLVEHADPLLRHFGVHSRCLIAIPLLIVAEGLAQRFIPLIVGEFVNRGLVGEAELPAFRQCVENAKRLLDSKLAFLVIMGLLVFGVANTVTHIADAHETVWAMQQGQDLGSLGWAGWWFILVSRPVYTLLLLGWIWRVVCLFAFFHAVSKLDLKLAPTHADKVGGLGFLEEAVAIFMPVALASSVVLASNWAHNVLYHDVHVASLKPLTAVYLILVLGIFLSPWLAFSSKLKKFRRESILAYGALLARHGQSVHRRWIDGEDLQDAPLLSAPELGPVADVSSLFDVVQGIRTIPLRKKAIVQLLVAALLPLLAVYAIEIPIPQLLKQLAGTLLV